MESGRRLEERAGGDRGVEGRGGGRRGDMRHGGCGVGAGTEEGGE